MKTIRLAMTLALALAAGSAIAQAQDRSVNCDRALAYDDLVGNYTITLGTTLISAPGGPPMAMGAGAVVQGTLALIGDALLLTAPSVGDMHVLTMSADEVILRFAGTSEPGWRWSQREEIAGPSSDDLGLVLGCDINRLPRLVGSGSGVSADGIPVSVTYRLIAPQEDHLYGQFQWHAEGMTMTRPVSFEEIK